MLKKSQSFLEYVNDNFHMQAIDLPARRGVVLGLVLPCRVELVGKEMLQCSLYCSDQLMAELEILMAMRRSCSSLTTLDLRRANFGFFKDLLVKVSQEKALEGRGA